MIESIEEELSREGPTLRRVDLLNNLASQVIYQDLQRALQFSQEAQRLADDLDYRAGRARSMLHQAHCNQLLSRNESAFRQLVDVLPLLKEQHDVKGEANALQLLGEIHLQTGNFKEALEHQLQSLKLAQELANDKYIGSIFVSIGRSYGELKQFDEAIEYFSKALEIFQREDHRQGVAVCLNNLGTMCYHSQQIDQGLDYLDRAVKLAEEIAFHHIQIYSLNLMGSIFIAREQHADAERHLQRSLELALAAGDRFAETNSLTHLAQLKVNIGAVEQARDYCTRAHDVAILIEAKAQLRDIYELFSKIADSEGDIKAAFDYYRKFHISFAEINNAEAQKLSSNFRIQLDMEKVQADAEIHRLKNVELAGALRQLEAANENLKILNKEKNEFLGIASHDLRAPLSVIHNDSRSLHMDFPFLGNDDILRIAERVQRSSGRMLELIANLLDINRIEARKARFNLQSLDWRRTVLDLISQYEKLAERKNIELRSDLPAAAASINADRSALDQILGNLVSNALKFSPAATTVSIRLYRADQNWRCEVADQGPGLTADDKSRLFRKFERLSAQPTGGEQSTGLGLSIVKMLTEALGGSVRCESEKGQGATFIVEFSALN